MEKGPTKKSRRPQSPVDVLEHRDACGQAQVCRKGHQGSSADRLCQPSFHCIKFWHVRNPLLQSIRLRPSVLVRYFDCLFVGIWMVSFYSQWFFCLRVGFLLKTDSGYPKDTGVNKPWQPLGFTFTIAPIGQFHQSPPSPIPGDLGKLRSQSPVSRTRT